jgi:glycerate 2-kinase
MISPEKLFTQSLCASSHGERVVRVMAAALNAVDPAHALRQHMLRDNNILTINGQIYNLDDYQRVLLVGFGKASIPMGAEAAKILGDYITTGILISKSIPPQFTIPNSPFSILKGSHPIPDENSTSATQQIVDLLARVTERDLVLCLISGGGSALLALPAPGITIDDIQSLTKTLFACGATINEINCIRKHLSQVKGGQLAKLAAPAQVATLILSDVVGDPLDVIASGPTTPDLTKFGDALEILKKYGITGQIPSAIRKRLRNGAIGKIPETPKAEDAYFKRVQNTIIGDNYLAAKAAIQQAQDEGYSTLLLTTSLQGEACQVGPALASILRQVATSGEPIPRPACIVAGGETTVTIQGDGLGGRNQELALSTVESLAGLPNVMLVTLATDGEDGPTNAAGAVVTGETLSRAGLSGLNPSECLSRNASYEFFDPLGDLLKPGSTLTNVNDLVFLFAG